MTLGGLPKTPTRRGPRSVVAFGGGTGLPSVLRGLRELRASGAIGEVTAVVTMTDDGGSSGRLRRSRGMLPPGDLRNCLVALAQEEDLMARLFQHRYGGTEGIGGHTVGNLILAALAEQTGCFLEAVELSSRVLRVAGRILPATLDSVSLEATMADGTRVSGETLIASSGQAIRKVSLQPDPVQPTPGVLEAIAAADIVVLGPGSLYTSVVPNLLVNGIAPALRRSQAVVVLVANLVSEPGETGGLRSTDHLRVLDEHAGGPFVDAVLAHEGQIDEGMLDRYEAEGAFPLSWPDESASGPRIYRRNLMSPGPKLRHDPEQTAQGLLEAWRDGRSVRLVEKAR